MRIGVTIGNGSGRGTDLEAVVREAQRVERLGFASAWMAGVFALDAIGTLTVAGRETDRIELGTAVVPTYPRHPVAMAQQALTAQAACRGRFVLGVGLSHRFVIEDLLGLSYRRRARHMEEYLSVLGPLVEGKGVDFAGEEYRVKASLSVDGGAPVPVVVAALGPAMLRVAGRLASGTLTWMTGPRTLEALTVPTLTRSAREAGRAAPRVIAGLPVALVRDPQAARERAARAYSGYAAVPSYRAMLEREGVDSAADIALVGDEAGLRDGLRRLEEVGVTDLCASLYRTEEGAVARTLEFLGSLT